jgi:hypothetical protein
MRRKLQILATVVAGLALVGVAACGGDDDSSSDDSTTTTEAPPDTTADDTGSAEAYVSTVCTEIGVWADQLQGFGSDLETAASKDDFIATLGELKSATATLGENVAAAGAPDISDGEQIASTLVFGIDTYEEAVDEATTLAESLPEDQTAAQSGIDQILSDLIDAEGEFAGFFSDVPPELRDAFDAEPACSSLPG